MELLLLLFTLALQSGLSETAEIPTQPLNLDKFKKVRLNERNYEKVHNLHTNWYAASIKALLAQLGRELYEKISLRDREILARCLDDIDDKRDLVLSARCFVKARSRFLRSYPHDSAKDEVIFVGNQDNLKKSSLINFNLDNNQTAIGSVAEQWTTVGQTNGRQGNTSMETTFPAKKDIGQSAHRSSTRLRKYSAKRKRLRFKKIPKSLPAAHFEEEKNVSRTKHHYRLVDKDKQANNEDDKGIDDQSWGLNYKLKNEWKVKKADVAPSLFASADKTPIARIANLISRFSKQKNELKNATDLNEESGEGDNMPFKWQRLYKTLAQLKEQNELRRSSPGAKVYTQRMYDLVLRNEQPTMSAKQQQSPQGLMEMALNILDGLTGDKSRKRQRESNVKVLSPRFAPVMRDKIDAADAQLSPTIFALYDDNNDDGDNMLSPNKDLNRSSKKQQGDTALSIAPVPKLLKAVGMTKQDREAILELLMDVSGATNYVDDAVGLLKNLDFFGMDNEILSSHDRLSTIYEKLKNSLNKRQSEHLDSRGFAFLERDQVDHLIKEQHANLSDTSVGLEHYSRLDCHEAREEALWQRVECIAENIPDEECLRLDDESLEAVRNKTLLLGDGYRRWWTRRRRRRRDLSKPSILEPVVLAPYMFSPVFGLTVLGPVVLSPSIFSPLILNPAVLSPYVLSPGIPMPFILSPYVLSPYVLSPLVMAPFILNPYVLSPNVINPYLLSPLILSPFVLSPDILSPTALGGAVLSPSVASPSILTESFLSGSWLSPSFLSK